MVKRDVFRLLEAAPISEEMSHNGIAAERAFVPVAVYYFALSGWEPEPPEELKVGLHLVKSYY